MAFAHRHRDGLPPGLLAALRQLVDARVEPFGAVLSCASRVMAAGHGGQILVAESTTGLLSGADLVDVGPRLRQSGWPGTQSAARRLAELLWRPGLLHFVAAGAGRYFQPAPGSYSR